MVVIVVIVSAVALPAVLPALNRRQTSDAARLLQAALAGARDKAIHDGQPGGIRLLPDPAFPIEYPSRLNIDTGAILAFNRILPIGTAPEYSDGKASIFPRKDYSSVTGLPCLVLEAAPLDADGLPNPPTNWFWNIRVGDKVQIGGAGPWYAVAGPIQIAPGSSTGNPEGFVNVGLPGSPSPLGTDPTFGLPYEYLMLTNGRDDGSMAIPGGRVPTPDGWVDSGWDGVDNDGDGAIDEADEWESERWLTALPPQGSTSLAYTIRRRPAPIAGAREVSLPSSVVIDATSWAGTRERSRLPVSPLTGYVDIVLNPDGTVLPTSAYGVPSSARMEDAFYHFWLADRSDLAPVDASQGGVPYLPVPPGVMPDGRFGGNAQLKGQYALVTLFARTGMVTTVENPPFFHDSTRGFNSQVGTYGYNNPFAQAQQGVR